jgi:hypothetical protein
VNESSSQGEAANTASAQRATSTLTLDKYSLFLSFLFTSNAPHPQLLARLQPPPTMTDVYFKNNVTGERIVMTVPPTASDTQVGWGVMKLLELDVKLSDMR